jgi:hypothetical protein
MSSVLTTASTVACPASGRVSPSGRAKLTVGGQPVVCLDGIAHKSVSGCLTPDNPNTPTTQCRTVATVSGAASRLKVNNDGVALGSSTGATDGSLNTLTFTAGQSKLTAV